MEGRGRLHGRTRQPRRGLFSLVNAAGWGVRFNVSMVGSGCIPVRCRSFFMCCNRNQVVKTSKYLLNIGSEYGGISNEAAGLRLLV